MADFDPDAFLSEPTPAPVAPADGGFDPDAFLASDNAPPRHESTAPQWMKSMSGSIDQLPTGAQVLGAPLLAPLSSLPDTYDIGKEALKGIAQIPGKLGASFSAPGSKTPGQIPGSDAFEDQRELFKRKAIELGADEQDAELRADTLVKRMQRGEALQSALFGAFGVLAAPLLGAYRHYVSRPTENAGGPPMEVTEGVPMVLGAAAGLRPGMNALRGALGRPLEGEIQSPTRPPGGPGGGTGGLGREAPVIEGEWISPTTPRPGYKVGDRETRLLPHDYSPEADTGRYSAGAAAMPGGPAHGLSPESIALLKEDLAEFTPGTLGQRLENMSPHQPFAHISENTRSAAGGLYDTPGLSKVEIYNTVKALADERPERIEISFNRGFGPSENTMEVQKQLQEAKNEESSPFWRKFLDTPIPPTDRLIALEPRLRETGAWKYAEKELGIEGSKKIAKFKGRDGQEIESPTPAFYEAVRQGLEKQIATLYTEPGDNASAIRRRVGLFNAVKEAIDAHPDRDVAGMWGRALEVSGKYAKAINAMEMGERLMTNAIHEYKVPEILGRYDDWQRGFLEKGIRKWLHDQLGRKGSGIATINTILTGPVMRKITMVIGEERAEALFRDMHHEREMIEHEPDLIGNKRTGASATGRKLAADRYAPPLDQASGIVEGIGKLISEPRKTISKFATRKVQEKLNADAIAKHKRIAEELARVHTMQGPERDALARLIVGEENTGPVPMSPSPQPAGPAPASPGAPVGAQFTPHANAEEATQTLRQFGYTQADINKMGGDVRKRTADMFRKAYPNGPPPAPVADFPADREANLPRPKEVKPPIVQEQTTPKGKKPVSLLEFIASHGGISPDDPLIGDVRSIIGKNNLVLPGYGGLIRQGGKGLDSWREAAVEAKYLFDSGDMSGREADTTINTLLDAMEREARGEKQYRAGEQAPEAAKDKLKSEHEQSQRNEIENGIEAQDLDREVARYLEIKPKDIDPAIRRRAIEIMMTEGERDPITAFERAMEEDIRRAEEARETEAFGDEAVGNRMAPQGQRNAPERERETGEAVRAYGEGDGTETGSLKREQRANQPVSSWLQANRQDAVDAAKKLGKLGDIGRMAREGKTAAEISKALNGTFDVNDVRAIRDYLGIAPAGEVSGMLLGRMPKGAETEPLRRKVLERGRSGRPIKESPLAIGRENDILDAGLKRSTGPVFHSAVAKAIDAIPANKMQPGQWLATLTNKPGVKTEELKWLGLEDWLNQQKGPVTKQQIADFVRANQIEVKEITKGANQEGWHITPPDRTTHGKWMVKSSDYNSKGARFDTEGEARAFLREKTQNSDSGPSKFSQYQLPGGENYRELLLALPSRKESLLPHERGSMVNVAKNEALDFRSSHWDEPNVLAHVRFNDRTIDGKKTLLIEEIQSDWHQKGRETGYVGSELPSNLEVMKWPDAIKFVKENFPNKKWVNSGQQTDGYALIDITNGETPLGVWGRNLATEEDAIKQAQKNRPPDAPFKTTWPELSLKRMIRYAAENGYDQVAWTPGHVQAARYDLSKQISRIDYERTNEGKYELHAYDMAGKRVLEEDEIPIERVEELVGKEIAKKIEAGVGEKTGGAYREWRRMSGLDLKVGGEGMHGFYDKMLPTMANKLVKKFGAKVGQAEIETSKKEVRPDGERLYRNTKDIPVTTNVHTIPLTPALRRAALVTGFPQFSQGGAVRRNVA